MQFTPTTIATTSPPQTQELQQNDRQTLKTCMDESCYYCTRHPIRLPPEIFHDLSFFRLPRLSFKGTLPRNLRKYMASLQTKQIVHPLLLPPQKSQKKNTKSTDRSLSEQISEMLLPVKSTLHLFKLKAVT